MDWLTQGVVSKTAFRGCAVIVGVAAATACAHVKPEQMETELDRVREEMRASDEAVEQRLLGEMEGIETRLERRISSLEEATGELRREFNVTVERLEAAVRFNTPIHFAFDDATVQPQDEEVLDHFARVLAEYYDDATVTVEGFADPAGSPAYNVQLGQRRAEAVVEHLMSAGVPGDRIRAVSYGASRERQVVPGAQGPGEAGWQNRRVAMVVDFKPTTPPAPRMTARDDGID